MRVPIASTNIRQLPVAEILQKRKRFRRELSEIPKSQELRILVLGGSTTSEVVGLLELLLLADGFEPVILESGYNRYYEDAVMEPEKIREFRPDVIYIHTNFMNLRQFPEAGCQAADFEALVGAEIGRFRTIWESLQEVAPCQIIQNNFEHPPTALFGNSDSVLYAGKTRFVNQLNLEFAKAATGSRRLLIQDLNGLSARLGHRQWFDWNRWYSYKLPVTPEASHAIATSLAAMIGAMLGRAKKCLVLDLDNTLWGGVIGDDGLDKIQIGKDTPVAEAYSAFQQYCLELRNRGVLLAVCSKNDPEIARSGFTHPDSVLRLEHFSAFCVNWAPKHETIQAIARDLNLGLDSFVFVDDNPAERAIVAAQLPMVTVPDIGSDVAQFPAVLEAGHYFEAIHVSKEDLERADIYSANARRGKIEAKFASYDEFLASLQMEAEIEPFEPVYLERITQLINKTNQFNLTTRRYTFAEVEDIAARHDYIALYGKLTDVFGDNGLISVIIARRDEGALHIDLWLMSCRVLKRNMEMAMLDALVQHAKAAGVDRIIGCYRRSPKNALVEQHYADLGFTLDCVAEDNASSTWSLRVDLYRPQNRHIKMRTPVVYE
jgi:FkbH-like protein